jgi:hypothetical protein|nr:MAG TPA: hypothetical protein [Caudoviricetes sp.]
MLVNDKSKKKDTQFIPNKPFIRDEKLLKLYQNYTEGKKFTRLSLSEPVVSFEPAVTKRLKPTKFALVLITDLRSDVFVDNVELINRRDKVGTGIAGKPDTKYLYGWVAENTYRFAVMLFDRILHVIDFDTETLESKDVTDAVDLAVINLFPFGYDDYYSVDSSAVYYDMVSGYFFVFHRQTSLFGSAEYGNDENGKPRGEFNTGILGSNGYYHQRTKEIELLAKALRFYGGILTDNDSPIVTNELAAFWRSSIDSTRIMPDQRVVSYILTGRVSDDVYDSGDVKRLISDDDNSAYDYDDPPF